MDLTRHVRGMIRRHDLFRAGDLVLVGVSGGADSMALLHVLHALAPDWPFRLRAVHVHHGMRGTEADRDAAFVRARCRELGLACDTVRRDVPALARRRKLSLEMAARAVRYAAFAQIARRAAAPVVVATAHTADDQAETVLLNLARGAGIGGLAGIPRAAERAGLRLARPLLDVRRADVIAYLRRRGLAWREDASNADPAFARNRVRHIVLPCLETGLNPDVRGALRRLASIAGEENRWMDAMAGDILRACAAPGDASGELDAAALARYPRAARRRVLLRWLAASGAVDPADRDFARIERLDALLTRRRGTGREALPRGWEVRRRYDRLQLVRRDADAVGRDGARIRLAPLGETLLPAQGLRVAIGPGRRIVRERGLRPGVLPATASISRAAVGRKGLYLRYWKPGDRMRPLGMQGSRKVQDIFTDAKVPPEQRGRIPLIECGGELVWLPGYRVARGWEVLTEDAPTIAIRIERL